MSEETEVEKGQAERTHQESIDLLCRDSLTNLYSRRYFQEYLETELIRSRRYSHSLSLCFIQVDHLKQYMDAHGRKEGDGLLRFMGDLLKTSIRATDLTCRYDEDRFVLVLPETPKKGGRTVAEKMRKTVSVYPFEGRDTLPSGSVTVSVGVVCFPDDAWEGGELIDTGNEALGKAKRGGGNRIWN